jgi:hypothetical protein
MDKVVGVTILYINMLIYTFMIFGKFFAYLMMT